MVSREVERAKKELGYLHQQLIVIDFPWIRKRRSIHDDPRERKAFESSIALLDRPKGGLTLVESCVKPEKERARSNAVSKPLKPNKVLLRKQAGTHSKSTPA